VEKSDQNWVSGASQVLEHAIVHGMPEHQPYLGRQRFLLCQTFFYWAVLIQLLCGMRPAGIAQLRCADIADLYGKPLLRASSSQPRAQQSTARSLHRVVDGAAAIDGHFFAPR
jgi:hypothetical protein